MQPDQDESCHSPESSGVHPWSLLSGGSAEPPTVVPSAPDISEGELGSEVLSQDAGWVPQPGNDSTVLPAANASFAAYLESLIDDDEGEADWYAPVALEAESQAEDLPSVGSEAAQSAPELPPQALASPYDELDVQREAAEVSSRVFAANLPKQAWEGPTCLSYPWERPAKRRATVLGFLDVLEPVADEALEDQQLGKLPPVAKAYLRRLPVARESSDERTHALKRLKFLIMWDPDSTSLASSLSGAATRLMDDALVQQSFSDAFRSKATGTLLKRAGSLERYFRWAVENQVASPFSVGESVIYDYLSELFAKCRVSSYKRQPLRRVTQVFAFSGEPLPHGPPCRVVGKGSGGGSGHVFREATIGAEASAYRGDGCGPRKFLLAGRPSGCCHLWATAFLPAFLCTVV